MALSRSVGPSVVSWMALSQYIGTSVVLDGSQPVSGAFSRFGCFVPNRLWGSQSVCVAPQSVCGAPQSVFGALSGLG